MEFIFAFITGVLVFLACAGSFSLGFKFGYSVLNGEQPKIEIKPAKPEKTPSEWEEGFRNIMQYEGSENGQL